MQRVRKYIPFVVINNMKCFKHYVTPRFPKLEFVNELLEVREFNEKLIFK